jgi:hypothetical protein
MEYIYSFLVLGDGIDNKVRLRGSVLHDMCWLEDEYTYKYSRLNWWFEKNGVMKR